MALVTVEVEWMDGERRSYPHVGRAESGTDGVLRLYTNSMYGQRELIAALPTVNIREWKSSE